MVQQGPLVGQQPQQTRRIPSVDRSQVLSGQTSRVDVRYRRLNRVRGTKGHIGTKEHMSRAEELEDAANRVWRAEQRRIDVEPPEVVERRLRQAVFHLPIAGTHRKSGGEVWHHAATVVRDHELARVTLHVPGIDETRQGGGGLVGPANGPPQAKVGPALGRIVGPCRAPRRAQPHGATGILKPREQRLEARIVKRHAQDVGVRIGFSICCHLVVLRIRALGEQFAEIKGHPCQALAKRLLRHQDEVFVFVRQPGVPADNTLAQRSLRPLVSARKISGGARSAQGSQTRMTLTTLFQTWQARGLHPLHEGRRMVQSPFPQL
jgi:hypothetical protein